MTQTTKTMWLWGALLACAALAADQGAGKRDGKMWHGGKVRAPVQLQATGHGAVDPDRDVALVIDATATAECNPLRLTVTGTGALQVRGGEERHHGRLDTDQKDSRTVTLRVPAGRGGYAVVRAACGEGDERRVTVQNYAVYAKGVDPKQGGALMEKPAGELTTGAEGQPVILLPSQP